MKKSWSQPRLIVLVRGSANEYLLSGCKSYTQPYGGPTTFYASQCWYKVAEPDYCGACSGEAVS
jgi:hypothetical protein